MSDNTGSRRVKSHSVPEPSGRKGVRVLGIDTSLRSTGVAVVEAVGSSLRGVEHGAFVMPANLSHSKCLDRIYSGIADIVDRTAPEAAAIEGAFYCRNVKTAMILGQVRGVAIAACAGRGVPVYEYAPRRVKQAVVGFGSADKEQVRKMVVSLLGLAEEPGEDAGDALAIAICHLHNRTGYAALMPEEI
jgi:crossover junction endodeoxyribonuclease RuvC